MLPAGVLRYLVPLYALVLASMAWRALARGGRGAAGALLFLASDALLAYSLFGGRVPYKQASTDAGCKPQRSSIVPAGHLQYGRTMIQDMKSLIIHNETTPVWSSQPVEKDRIMVSLNILILSTIALICIASMKSL